jgi:hypothetical protein
VRVVLGRIALVLGVVVVAAMAWYGATALFDIGKSGDDDADPSAERGCPAATKRDARVARRVFVREHGRARWFSGIGVSDTRFVDEIANGPADVIDFEVPEIEGTGAILLVSTVAGAKVPHLPGCLKQVPVVYMANGPFQLD